MAERRLLESGASPTERLLLEATLDDGPSAEDQRRILAALGASITRGAATAMPQQPGPVRSSSLGRSLAKYVLVAGVGGLATLATQHLLHPPAEVVRAQPPLPVLSRASPPAPPAPPLMASAPPQPVLSRAPLPAPPAPPLVACAPPLPARTVSRPERRALPPAAPAASPLEEEVRLLDEARDALGAELAVLALDRVATYRERFPEGVLRAEAQVVEISALHQLGQVAEAKERARAFLAAHLDSPFAERIRAEAQLPDRSE